MWICVWTFYRTENCILLLCERSQAEMTKGTLSAMVYSCSGPRASVESAIWGITTHYPHFLPISWLLYSHVRAANDSCAWARNGSAALRDRFGVIIVCLSTRLNELLLCCILAITMALIVRTPCGTIKIPSESPICLPAMPAVHVPFLGLRQSPLLVCIIHKLPDDFRDLPGDSWAWEWRRMKFWMTSFMTLWWSVTWRSVVLVETDLFWSEQQERTLLNASILFLKQNQLRNTDSFQKCSSTCLPRPSILDHLSPQQTCAWFLTMFSFSTWHYDNVISTSSKTNLDVNLLFVEMSDGESFSGNL